LKVVFVQFYRGTYFGMKNPENLIEEALERGQSALSEHHSKRFLSGFGIPITREILAYDADSAAAGARDIGFPVVLKASGPKLTHKSEAGGVVLNLRNEEDVKREGQRLLRLQGCEALLIQEMVEGHRELVCGLIRNPLFGPCVMFGLGGVLTEILEDVVFRVAPLSSWDARDMVQEIRGKKILKPFRGEEAADLSILCQTLMTLGEIGLRYEQVIGLDINPLKIRPNGKPVAVDALIVLQNEGRRESSSSLKDSG